MAQGGAIDAEPDPALRRPPGGRHDQTRNNIKGVLQPEAFKPNQSAR